MSDWLRSYYEKGAEDAKKQLLKPIPPPPPPKLKVGWKEQKIVPAKLSK